MRCRAALVVLALLACAAQAQQPVAPHMEGCVKPRAQNGVQVIENQCREAVVVQFLDMGDGRRVEGVVVPNAFLDTGMKIRQAEEGYWIYTACPVGYAPSVSVSRENEEQIADSLYNCVRKPSAGT